MAPPPPRPTVETDDEDDNKTETPTRSNIGTRRKSMSSSGSTTARRDAKTETRRRSDKSSDSGYSTGTKGSTDTGASGKPTVERVEPAEIPPQSPVRTTRPPMEPRMSSSKSEVSRGSSKSTAKAPSRAPSVRSKGTSRSEKVREEECRGCPDCIKKERRQSRVSEAPRVSTTQPSQQPSVRTSPTSSRASRAPAQNSQEMPPPARPRPRSDSMSRAGRPASYHGSMGSVEAFYANGYAGYDHGPPLSRSAYVSKDGYPPVRPGLAVLSSPQSYAPTMAPSMHPSQPQQLATYDPNRMAVRTQTEYSTSSTNGTNYSARRPVSVYNDLPTSYVVPAESPQSASPTRERKAVLARRPNNPPPYQDDESDSESSEDDDEDDAPPQYASHYLPIRQAPGRDDAAYNARMRGEALPGTYGSYGSYGTSPAREFPAYDNYYDQQCARDPDYYRSTARSKGTNSSSQSRRQSVASSGGGTRGTSYSASSGSGGNSSSQKRRSVYEPQFGTSPVEQREQQAEKYMKNIERQAPHTRYQQPPQLTQESLRQQQARAIEAKRSSKGSMISSHASSSYRSRTVTAGDEQAVRLVFNTNQGLDVALEGNTDNRPIRIYQKPGEQTAEMIIGGAGNTRREETVYNGGSSSRSTGRTNGESSRVSTKASSRAAVSGRRERARTTPDA